MWLSLYKHFSKSLMLFLGWVPRNSGVTGEIGTYTKPPSHKQSLRKSFLRVMESIYFETQVLFWTLDDYGYETFSSWMVTCISSVNCLPRPVCTFSKWFVCLLHIKHWHPLVILWLAHVWLWSIHPSPSLLSNGCSSNQFFPQSRFSQYCSWAASEIQKHWVWELRWVRMASCSCSRTRGFRPSWRREWALEAGWHSSYPDSLLLFWVITF